MAKARKPIAKPKKAAAPSPPPTVTSGNVISTEVAAKLLMVTDEWVRRLTVDGWIKKIAKGQYNVVDVVQGYINYLKDEQRRASKSASASRVQDARAREIELRVNREEGRLVEIEDVEAVVADVFGTFRSELAGVPASCARDLEQRRVIEASLNGTIDRCRERFEEAGRALRTGGEVAMEGEEATA